MTRYREAADRYRGKDIDRGREEQERRLESAWMGAEDADLV